MNLRICHLYPDMLNLYGDFGNIIALKYRAGLRKIDITYTKISTGDKLDPDNYDFFFIGGGQDEQQSNIITDLFAKKSAIMTAAAAGKPFLCICGGYQLFGRYFMTHSGKRMECLDLLPVYTEGRPKRLIGDTVYKAEWLADGEDAYLFGFENHSGNTILLPEAKPLAKTIIGYGNNISGKDEGCMNGTILGTYAHGSFLPKNPAMTDYLLGMALQSRYKDYQLPPADNTIEKSARQAAAARFGLDLITGKINLQGRAK